jgi:hypothetical protein
MNKQKMTLGEPVLEKLEWSWRLSITATDGENEKWFGVAVESEPDPVERDCMDKIVRSMFEDYRNHDTQFVRCRACGHLSEIPWSEKIPARCGKCAGEHEAYYEPTRDRFQAPRPIS